jgi:hypothetical protein
MIPKKGQFLGAGKLGGGGPIAEPMSGVKVISKDSKPKPELKVNITSDYSKDGW